MKSLVCVLAGAAVAVLVAGPLRAGSTSTNLTVTVTVVAPGSLGADGGATAEPARSPAQRPAMRAPATRAPANDTASPAQ
jgi:hypothetical protein